jgi:hypothetical protein
VNAVRAPLPLSALATSLPLDVEAAVRQLAALGFRHVDLVGQAERPAAHLDALAETGYRDPLGVELSPRTAGKARLEELAREGEE